jgi:hypothetical protein
MIGLQKSIASQQVTQNVSTSSKKVYPKITAEQRKRQSLINEICREISRTLSKETDMAVLQRIKSAWPEFIRRFQQQDGQKNTTESAEGIFLLV